MKLTIDSTETLENTLRVVGALYNVTLEVSPNGTKANGSGVTAGNGTSASARPTRGSRGSGRRRPVKRARSKQASSKPASSKPVRAKAGAVAQVSTADVRTWARDNGYTVADRGRVPTEVVTAYRNAQPA